MEIDANKFTVQTLKEKLRSLNMATGGSKAELIKRLIKTDPTGRWMEDMLRELEDSNGSELVTEESLIDVPILEERSRHDQRDSREPFRAHERERERERERELDLTRRENELMRRELELMRRENELLRIAAQQPPLVPEAPQRVDRTPAFNLSALKELLPEFTGQRTSYRIWEEQLTLLQQMYRLDENSVKLLIGSRLSGSAAAWFQSMPEYLTLPVEQLLSRMKSMFDHRETRLSLRREFEGRTWRHGETFTEYFHQKLILANRVPISEEEIMDYIIEGITVPSIRQQATIQRFGSKEERC